MIVLLFDYMTRMIVVPGCYVTDIYRLASVLGLWLQVSCDFGWGRGRSRKHERVLTDMRKNMLVCVCHKQSAKEMHTVACFDGQMTT